MSNSHEYLPQDRFWRPAVSETSALQHMADDAKRDCHYGTFSFRTGTMFTIKSRQQPYQTIVCGCTTKVDHACKDHVDCNDRPHKNPAYAAQILQNATRMLQNTITLPEAA